MFFILLKNWQFSRVLHYCSNEESFALLPTATSTRQHKKEQHSHSSTLQHSLFLFVTSVFFFFSFPLFMWHPLFSHSLSLDILDAFVVIYSFITWTKCNEYLNSWCSDFYLVFFFVFLWNYKLHLNFSSEFCFYLFFLFCLQIIQIF